MRPGRLIGSDGARALAALGGDGLSRVPSDALASRVQHGRVRRARMLAPLDALSPPTGPEWALTAVLHDLLQATNPRMNAIPHRDAATRIVDSVARFVEEIEQPTTVGDALSRHTWFARVFEIARTDTKVSWWTGSRTFRGVDPPRRLQAWPSLRRVDVTRTSRSLLDLSLLPLDRARYVEGIRAWLSRSPITDLATCTRSEPCFSWGDATLGLVATPVGRTVALRALARLPVDATDAALGRAIRDALTKRGEVPRGVLAMLADRAMAAIQTPALTPDSPPIDGATTFGGTDAGLARGLGAIAAANALRANSSRWDDTQRQTLTNALELRIDEAKAMLASLQKYR